MAGNAAGETGTARAWSLFRSAAEPQLEQFRAALARPRAAQEQRLCTLLASNANCEFGRRHGFADIDSIDGFRQRVPVAGWQDMAPWIERAQREPFALLSAETPLFFELTSGSGAASKAIPMTPDLLRDFQAAIVPWLASLVDACPGIAAGRSYWAMSPVVDVAQKTDSGISIGGGSDGAYLAGSCAETLLSTVLNPLLMHADSQRWRDTTLAALIGADDLAMISVWSPTFLIALLRPLLDSSSDAATSGLWRTALTPARRNMVEQAVDKRNLCELWPQLEVVSCWMDGPSAAYASQLHRWFPQVRFLPKGLLATEGVVSTSWGASGRCPLAVRSHFLEFEDDNGQILLVDELVDGGRYRPLLTTGGGLYRYRLGDSVEVDGFIERTPCIRYVGRADARSDLVGEKLDAMLVGAALENAGGRNGIVIPVSDASPPHYLLLVEATGTISVGAVGDKVEQALLTVYHYRQARRLGQLGPLQTRRVASLGGLVHHAWEALGRRAGDAKPAALITSQSYADAILARVAADGQYL